MGRLHHLIIPAHRLHGSILIRRWSSVIIILARPITSPPSSPCLAAHRNALLVRRPFPHISKIAVVAGFPLRSTDSNKLLARIKLSQTRASQIVIKIHFQSCFFFCRIEKKLSSTTPYPNSQSFCSCKNRMIRAERYTVERLSIHVGVTSSFSCHRSALNNSPTAN